MQTIKQNKLPVIIIVVAAIAAVAGLKFGGFIGGEPEVEPKVALEPVPLIEPFVVNLADTDTMHYIKLSLAVEMEPMTEHDKHLFEEGAGGGGHGGGHVATGKDRVGSDPELRDVVIDTVSRYTSEELLTPKGKAQLKQELLHRFEKVAEKHQAKLDGKKKDAHGDEEAHHDPTAPPFHIQNVYFHEYAVQ